MPLLYLIKWRLYRYPIETLFANISWQEALRDGIIKMNVFKEQIGFAFV